MSEKLSERKNINRERRSSFDTQTHTCVVHERERERESLICKEEKDQSEVLSLIFLIIYIEEAFLAGFFSLGFSQGKFVLIL